MLGPTLILLGGVSFGVAGAVVVRANPSSPINDYWKIPRRVLLFPFAHWVLWSIGLFLSMLGASAWSDEIGYWSFLIGLLTVYMSLYAGQVFQRRRMSTQNESR